MADSICLEAQDRLRQAGPAIVATIDRPGLVAHCDWSVDARKRWMAAATRRGNGWLVHAPEPVGPCASLFARLAARAGAGDPVLVGVDFVLGLPAWFGERSSLPDFRSALQVVGSGAWSRWFDVCADPADISLQRPFYPATPGGRSRAQLLAGLGLDTPDDLLRLCERKTATRPAACSLFWTLGGNQVGKAALAGWRELLQPNLDALALWPFDGSLATLLAGAKPIVAETYPGDTYSRLGIARRPVWSKRTQSGRRAVAPQLLAWLERRGHALQDGLVDAIATGFTPDASGEDRFDALVGLFGMLDVVDGHQPEAMPAAPGLRRWEGWILGQS